MKAWWMLVLVLGAVTGVVTQGQEPAWQVGVGSVEITPEKPVVMAGYAARTKPFEKVDTPLLGRALAIKDSTGGGGIIVTMDLCIMPPEVAQGIREGIAARTSLNQGAVVLSLSHTHSGPAVSLKEAGTVRDQVNQGSADTVAYTKGLQQKMIDVAEQAWKNTKPATMSWGTGSANLAMNRRQFTEKGVVLGVNPRGPVDRSVPVLRIDGADGKPMVILFGYACHCTTLMSSHLGINADYPGYARTQIEERFPGAVAMFVAGCGGDANPYPRQQPGTDIAQKHGQELAAEVIRVSESKLAPVKGTLKCVQKTAQLPLEQKSRAELEKIAKEGAGTRKADAASMLAQLDEGKELLKTAASPVGAWQFGSDLTWITLPNEVVVDYVMATEKAIGPLKLWVSAYCHHVAGYVPSKRVLSEGGYETRGLYIGTGWFAAEVEEAVMGAVKEAAREAGR